jgi:hypothetical protein
MGTEISGLNEEMRVYGTIRAQLCNSSFHLAVFPEKSATERKSNLDQHIFVWDCRETNPESCGSAAFGKKVKKSEKKNQN